MLFWSSAIRRPSSSIRVPEGPDLPEDFFLQPGIAGALELLDELRQLPLLPRHLARQLAELVQPLLIEQGLEVEGVLLQGGDLLLRHPGQPPVHVQLGAPAGQAQPELARVRGGADASGDVLSDVLQRGDQGLVPVALPGQRPGGAHDVPGERDARGVHRLLGAHLVLGLPAVAVRALHPGGEVGEQPLPQLGGATERLAPVLGGAVDHQGLLAARALLRPVHRVVVQRLDRVADPVPGGELQRAERPAVLARALPPIVVRELLPVALAVGTGPHQRDVRQAVVVGGFPAKQHLLVGVHLQLGAREEHRGLRWRVRLDREREVGTAGDLASAAAAEDDTVGARGLEHEAAAQVTAVLDPQRDRRPGAQHQLRPGDRPVCPGAELHHGALGPGQVAGARHRARREAGVGGVLVEHLQLAR